LNYFGVDSYEPVRRDDSVICDTHHSKVVPLEGGEVIPTQVSMESHPARSEPTHSIRLTFPDFHSPRQESSVGSGFLWLGSIAGMDTGDEYPTPVAQDENPLGPSHVRHDAGPNRHSEGNRTISPLLPITLHTKLKIFVPMNLKLERMGTQI